MPLYACPTCGKANTARHCPDHKPRHRSPSSQITGRRDWRRLRAAVLADCDVCWICGNPGADTVDHVQPVAHGGSNDLRNLRPAHSGCNKSKGAQAA